VELTVVIIMLAVGIGLAASVMVTFAAAQREADMSGAARANVAPDRNHIAASLLFNLLVAGGTPRDAALRAIRQGAGLAAPVTSAIDIVSWSERFAKLATPEQRSWLLDMAVRLVADRTTPVPLRQYSALLDLSFALGFQTDALAKLRDIYGFDYVDHAKNARPRSADRVGVSTPLYSRDQRETSELLRILGIEGPATRAAIIAAYRRLAAQHHPDKVFGEPAEVQTAAAARFIEITRAYETLLGIYGE
jgi:DnaJ-domain-containing protein 1